MKPPFVSPFGYTHPERPKREVCRYCYNEDTQRIVDEIDLVPYQQFYGDVPFKAFSCFCCGARFHFKIEEDTE